MCISPLQNPVLEAECSPDHCGIDVFFAENIQSGLFRLFAGLLALFCGPLFRSFSALIFIGFDYLAKTDQMVKEKKLTFIRKLLSLF
jgi:hypothetical protein